MTTLQEYLNQKYPTKEEKEKVEEIAPGLINEESKKKGLKPLTLSLEGGKLDVREYKNLKYLTFSSGVNVLKTPLTEVDVRDCSKLTTLHLTFGKLTSFDLSGCDNLTQIDIRFNKLTSTDFLNTIPNPEKLEELWIFNNDIQPTNIEVFSKFVNLWALKTGTTTIEGDKRNRFYGSFESLKGLIKLNSICIEATDVDGGLEYLPFNLGYKSGMSYSHIECSPRNTVSRCSQIQNQLRPYNYDLGAWQLAHPHKMYKSRPEIFFNLDTKSKWLTALRDKINKTQEKLNQTKKDEPQAIKRIKRLEMKLDNLKLIQDNISNHALIDKLQKKDLTKKEDKATQTEQVIVEYSDNGRQS